ncbi:MAG: ABC transporter permease [Methylococcales bacterium]|jgi:putative ABC transport system permease protein|nr:ABC transporter permease [Methylococcales bacterium]MBT7442880.1 ABC transporter permease [Methylococcales bacterium]
MNIVNIGYWELSIAALLVLSQAALNWRIARHLSTSMVISMCRMFIQLSLIALILTTLFEHVSLPFMVGIAVIMLLAAGFEVTSRQKNKFTQYWGYVIGAGSMGVSSFMVCIFALAILNVDPWYHPQYAIPLLGMLLGNTLNGTAICMDRLTESAVRDQKLIEARLLLGHNWLDATETQRHNALHSALIPTINSMAAAGLVSMPGMMTGQILAGVDPALAVKYQLFIFMLIAGSTMFSAYVVTLVGTKRLFDARQRLCLDRLK